MTSRQSASQQRKRDAGSKCVSVWLSPAEQPAFEAMRVKYGSGEKALRAGIVMLAEGK